MKRKLLIFDFDGTIADTLPVFHTILEKLAKKYNLKNVQNPELLRDKSARELMKISKVSWWKMPFLIRDAKKELSKQLEQINIIKDMRELIINLRGENHTVVILTSNSKANVEQFLEKHELKEHIDTVYGDVGIFGKAKKIDKAIKDQQFQKEDVVYIGDEIRDVEASKKVGIKIISVGWGLNTKEKLESVNPKNVVNTPAEIQSLII